MQSEASPLPDSSRGEAEAEAEAGAEVEAVEYEGQDEGEDVGKESVNSQHNSPSGGDDGVTGAHASGESTEDMERERGEELEEEEEEEEEDGSDAAAAPANTGGIASNQGQDTSPEEEAAFERDFAAVFGREDGSGGANADAPGSHRTGDGDTEDPGNKDDRGAGGPEQ